MKTGVIFDLDGTLLDTLEDLYRGVNYAMRCYGCPERTRQEVRRAVGNGARNLIRHLLPGKETDPPLEQVLADYQVYYDRLCVDGNTCPYPGVLGQLEQIAEKYPVAIVSNKPDISVKPLCQKFFPGIYALGASDDTPRKPAPDMVRQAMKAIGVENCIYVGDSEVDVLTARNTGVPCLSVLWGFRDREELIAAGATHLCKTVQDLDVAIENLMKTQ